MLPQASSSSTSSKRGRPRGTAKAERRLKRELSNKQSLIELLGAARDIISTFTSTAVSNPIVGVATAVISVDILHRVRVISDVAWAGALGAIGALTLGTVAADVSAGIGDVITGIGNIIPSIGAKSSEAPINDLIATANNPTYAPGRPEIAKKSVGLTEVNE